MNLQFYSKNFLIFIRKMHIKQRCKHEYLNRQDVNVFPFNLFFFFFYQGCFHFKHLTMKTLWKRYVLYCAEAKKAPYCCSSACRWEVNVFISYCGEAWSVFISSFTYFPMISLHLRALSLSHTLCLFYHRGVTVNLLLLHFILFKK